MGTDRSLATYLQDHLAGATGGLELALKLAGEYRDVPLGPFLDELARDVGQDKDTLEGVLASFDLKPDPLKQAVGWLGEKASRLKLTDAHNQPALKRMMELELMSLGIEGKLDLWRALHEVEDLYPELTKVDLADLTKRAESQRAGLEEHRLSAAREAFAAA